jgi:homoserine O-succinyltransferase
VRLSQAAATGSGRSPKNGGSGGWTCAFVNNMPDGAFDATERQFLDLLDAGSGPRRRRASLRTMSGVPRGERVAARIASEYLPVETMLQDPPDLLIVTGSNPVEERIEDEPYWDRPGRSAHLGE